MLTKPFKPLALAFLVNLIISVEDKIKYKKMSKGEKRRIKCEFLLQVKSEWATSFD